MTSLTYRNVSKSISLSSAAQRQFFWTLFSLVFILIALYVYFLSVSVLNVISREHIEQRIVEADAQVSELELTYLQKKNTVTQTFAHSLGFREIEDKLYVTRTSVASRLTLHEER